MGTQVKRWERLRRFIATTAAVVGSTALVVAAAASAMGVTSADLFSFTTDQTVPLPLAFDHFDGCGGDLNNDVDAVGNAWIAPSTDWRCQVAYSRARNRNLATTADSATVDIGVSDDIVITTYLERASRTASGAGSGVSLFHDGSYHMYIVYQRGADQLTLGKVDGSGDTEIVSVSYFPRTDTMDFIVEIHQPSITVTVNGTLLGTYTMTAGEIATFGSNTRFGLESDLDRRSQWSWFQIDDAS